jgi:two-component system cell cycle sensor histidine kinase/response regulator CckA
MAVHPADGAAVSDALATALRGERGSVTCRLVRRDGTVGWLSLGAEREIDAHGRVVALVGFVQPLAAMPSEAVTAVMPGPVAAPVAVPSPAARTSRVDGGVALLVEDEDTVRRVLGRMLGNMGYSVFEASTGDEALELIGCDEDGIDLVVTDIRMPGIQGPELASRIRAVLHDVPVLYVSGYAVDLGEEGRAGARTALLEKPFDADGLRAAIEALLDADG